jgi:hydrogenase maturation protease
MSAPKSVIVGLGNPILSDDAVGIVVAHRVYESLNPTVCQTATNCDANVDFIEAGVGGFELVEMLYGYDKAVIVDAMQTDRASPGEFFLVDLLTAAPPEIPAVCQTATNCAMTHHVGLIEGLELARRLNMRVPGSVRVYGIEVEDITTFGTSMTDAVAAAVPRMVEHILSAEFGMFTRCLSNGDKLCGRAHMLS